MIFLNSPGFTSLSNAIYMIIFIISVAAFLYSKKDELTTKRVAPVSVKDMHKAQNKKDYMAGGTISQYIGSIEKYLTENKNVKNVKMVGNAILAIPFFLAIIGWVFKGFIMGIATFVLINGIMSLYFKNAIQNKNKDFESKMPEAVDIMIRNFSRFDDLQSILYYTSLDAAEPFQSMTGEMARRMTSEGQLEVLEEYAEKTSSVWIHSMYSVLIKYKEDAKKEDTLVNLKSLRDMVDQDNKLRRSLVSDKRYTVLLNYIICAIAVVGNVVLIASSETARKAFFETSYGFLVLIGGYSCIGAVFFITKKLNPSSKMTASKGGR